METNSINIAGNVLARRYAEALFELAEEKKLLDEVAADMRLLKGLARENAEFMSIATHPRLARTDLVNAMQDVAKSAKLQPITANFLKLVAEGRRLSYLGDMADAFLGRLAALRGEVTAEVRVAKALSEAQNEKLAAQLRQLTGGKVQLAVKEDPALLGGITVQLGSQLIDASVKTKLARLERQLKSQGEAA